MQASIHPATGTVYSGVNLWILRFLPSLTDLAFLLPALWLFIRMDGAAVLLSDGDTGWHIHTGEWIWQHRAVPTTDLFSFTRPHGVWFAWEWLWDLLFAGVHHAGGLGAVAFVNVCLLGIVSVLLFRLIRRTTDNDLLSFGFTALAMAGTSIHWFARPHLVTWLFVLLFAHLILSAQRGDWRKLLILPVAMILWTNLHGAFFLGIFMLLLAAAGEALSALLHAQDFWNAAYLRTRLYLLTALGCAAATFVNPYGWRLHAHIQTYVLDSRLLDNIQEFQSINFHNPRAHIFECMLLIGLAATFWAMLRKQYGAALSLLFWAHLALLSGRNIPLFLLLAAPIAASMMQDLFQRASHARRLQSIAAFASRFADRIRPLERTGRLHMLSGVAVLVLAVCFAGGKDKFAGEFNTRNFPITALPFIKSARFTRLFTTDQWADYFVYHLYPSQPSFLDGRSDYFGMEVLDEYFNVVNARYDWEQNLSKYHVDSVALRPDAPVVSALKQSPNWKLRFDDGSVVVFAHIPGSRQPAIDARITQVSPITSGGRKQLGPTRPGLLVCLNTKTQERRSS